MIRSLLSLLAVLVAGLAVLFGRPWLYVITGVIVVGLLGLLGWWLWTTYATEDPDRPRPSPEPDAPDTSIVDIQPETAEEGPSKARSEDHPARAEPSETSPDAPEPSTPSKSGAALATHDPSADEDDTTESSPTTEADEEPTTSQEAPVLGALLESLRAALDAQTVCLLVQEEVALSYRIEALASTHDAVQRSGTFDTQTPLLNATMSRQSVSVQSLAEAEVAIEDLRYYEDPPPVGQRILGLQPKGTGDFRESTDDWPRRRSRAPAGRLLDLVSSGRRPRGLGPQRLARPLITGALCRDGGAPSRHA